MKKTCVKLLARTLAALLAFTVLLAAAAPAQAVDAGNLQFLVNKTHTLKSDYVPSDMVYMSNYMNAGGNVMMRRDAAVAMGGTTRRVTSFAGSSSASLASNSFTLSKVTSLSSSACSLGSAHATPTASVAATSATIANPLRDE